MITLHLCKNVKVLFWKFYTILKGTGDPVSCHTIRFGSSGQCSYWRGSEGVKEERGGETGRTFAMRKAMREDDNGL